MCFEVITDQYVWAEAEGGVASDRLDHLVKGTATDRVNSRAVLYVTSV